MMLKKYPSKIRAKKVVQRYLAVFLFCIVFSVIYELFSHKVISLFMVLMPIIPLLLGLFVFVVFWKTKKLIYTNWLSICFYNAGVATLSVFSTLMGVVEIYGTKNNLFFTFLIAGVAQIVLAIIVYSIKASGLSRKTKLIINK